MGILLNKGNHSNCRTSGLPVSDRRLGEPEGSKTSSNNWRPNNRVFSQISKQMGPLELNQFAGRLNAQVTKYVSLKPDQMAIATDAFMIKIGQTAGLCISSILHYTSLSGKSAKGGDAENHNTGMAESTILPVITMITANVNPRSNIVATTSESATVTRGGGGSLPLIENKHSNYWLEISSNQNRCKDYQTILHSYSLQFGIRDTISIQQLLATLEWLVS